MSKRLLATGLIAMLFTVGMLYLGKSPHTTAVASGTFTGNDSIDASGANPVDGAAEYKIFLPIIQKDFSDFIRMKFNEHTTLEGNIIAWGDYDQDGYPDLLTGCTKTDRYAYVIRNNTNGGFKVIGEPLPCGHNIHGRSQPWADYDGDGDLDLALPGRDESHIYQNFEGTFVEDYRSSLPVQYSGGAWFQWGDIDGINGPDLVIVGTNYSGLYTNDGTGHLTIKEGLPRRDNHSGDLGDFDNDGDLDLVLNGKTPGGPGPWHFEIFRNDNGTFSLWETLPGISGASTHWVDYDQDGLLDIFILGQDSSLSLHVELWHQDEPNKFTLDTNQPALDAYVALVDPIQDLFRSIVAWGDYDNDGDPDMIISMRIPEDWPNKCLTKGFRNHPEGTLVNDKYASLDGDSKCYHFNQWADFDQDGDLDLAASDSLSSFTKIFSNDIIIFPGSENKR